MARAARKEEGSMTVSLDVQEDIRRMDRDGATRADIARELHLSRNTVRKYADMEDMSPEPPASQERPHPAPRGDGTGECTLVRMGAVRCLVW